MTRGERPARPEAALCALWILAGVLLSAPACLVVPIPTPEHGLVAGTGVIPDEETRRLVVGETERSEVLLRFGQPAATRCDDRVLAYYWAVAHGWVVVAVGGPYSAAGGVVPIPKSYLVLLVFDDAGVLTHVDRIEDLFTSAPKIAGLLPEDCIAAARSAPPGPGVESLRELQRWHGYVFSALVEAAPEPPTASPALAVRPPIRVWIEPFSDARPPGHAENQLAKRGFETGAFGLWSYRRIADVLRAVVADVWRAAGHELQPGDPDLLIEGRLERIDMDVDWHWSERPERIATIEISLSLRAGRNGSALTQRRYTGTGRATEVRGTSDSAEWEKALDEALASLTRQIGADEALGRALQAAAPARAR